MKNIFFASLGAAMVLLACYGQITFYGEEREAAVAFTLIWLAWTLGLVSGVYLVKP